MSNMPVTPQPRRTLLWDEKTASYIWLDASARAAAARQRAKRLQFDALYTGETGGCAIASVYSPSDYDADTRTAARNSTYHGQKRKARNASRADAVDWLQAALMPSLVSALAAL